VGTAGGSAATRAIPDTNFNELFRKLQSHRDRAMAAFYVSSGARASELLGLTGDMINYGDQLIGVVRKGGARQWLPASPDAFVWLRLYQLDRRSVLAQSRRG
jgi:integrase/recombinase XerC